MRISQGLKSALSFGVGMFITFSADHSAQIGLIALAIFAIGLAILNVAVALIQSRGVAAIESIPLSVISLTIGLFAAFLVFQADNEGKIGAFIALVTTWGLLAGVMELYQSRKTRGTSASRDYLISAVLALLLGVLFLVAPLDIISAVGFFGAYLVLSAVHIGIAAASPAK